MPLMKLYYVAMSLYFSMLSIMNTIIMQLNEFFK